MNTSLYFFSLTGFFAKIEKKLNLYILEAVFLHSSAWPGTHVDQAGLELKDSPSSASLSAGIKRMHHYVQGYTFEIC